jgi:opacity protein-like surface antigen
MKKSFYALFILLICSATSYFTPDAGAIGIGVYGNGGGGQIMWDNNTPEMRFGGGFILDTNCAGNNLFNYRLNLGVNSLITKYQSYDEYWIYSQSAFQLIPNSSYEKIYMKGTTSVEISMSHVFGFGVLRTQNIRLWLGPEVFLAGTTGHVKGVTAGLGIALGLNINIGDSFTISISGSGRLRGGYRDYNYTKRFTAVDPTTIYPVALYPESKRQVGVGVDGLAIIAFMYRINDKF